MVLYNSSPNVVLVLKSKMVNPALVELSFTATLLNDLELFLILEKAINKIPL